jgi:colanic acid/amylovoran biosynthesis protein
LESLFAAIDSCRFVVTGTYHAGVFALSRGRPVIALASNQHYSQKFRGLAAYFGGACSVVDLDDEFESKLVEAITAAENAAESLGRAATAVASRHSATQRALWGRLRGLR